MAVQFWGRIVADSPRAADWIRILGTDLVRLKSGMPFYGRAESGRAMCYALDLDALRPEQFDRLCLHRAQEVAAEARHDGVQILSEDIVVSMEHV